MIAWDLLVNAVLATPTGRWGGNHLAAGSAVFGFTDMKVLSTAGRRALPS